MPDVSAAFPEVAPPEETLPYLDDLRRHRRALHRIPEVDFDLPQTISYVRGVLERVAAESPAGRAGRVRVLAPSRSCVCAFFDAGSERSWAVRADMDALPVTEGSGVPFASEHSGKMHACGHDGHMAMVLVLATWLGEHLDEVGRSALLVFQPAEETTGGARLVCESGVFEECRVDRIVGFHLWPDLPAGHVASRPGPLLAAANETTATFEGRASHIAKASQGADALLACTQFVGEAYACADRLARRGPLGEGPEPILLKFGHLVAGEVRNQIAAHAVVEGSLRTFSPEMRGHAMGELISLAEGVGRAHGCAGSVRFSEGYPPVVNDAALYETCARALDGRGSVPALRKLPEPLLIAEDFAWYQQYLPGVFLLLGTGTGIPLHASSFGFDESVLCVGLAAYLALVRQA